MLAVIALDAFLEKWLANNHIDYILHAHQPVFTVEEAQIHTSHIPGLHCKNLFLRDSKSATFYLLTLPALKKINLKVLRKKLQAKKLSFAKTDQFCD